MNSKSPKPLPRFSTDQQAEDFVADADLTEFDLSSGRDILFERSQPPQGHTHPNIPME
ncbi:MULTISPECIES: CopG family antitoxin [unclassified Rhizobium]|jgi:hypothetical protein|uniref:CopG family antitoxin n=1 Tax=unclassified Rhizobium TaxID=2613769 RepID=UPI0013AF33AE|nr:CopG family antitoxin [Rhizobium sp. UBA1881]